jgi:uncharacterized protein (TIGR02145 family)
MNKQKVIRQIIPLVTIACILTFTGCDKDSPTKPLDCYGLIGGDAFIDACGECVGGDSGLIENYLMDCDGICEGTSLIDDCGVCSGGTSGHDANSDQDCAGVCFGNVMGDCTGLCDGLAFMNICDACVGGNTGLNDYYCEQAIDIDGNIYETIIIGDQVWMAENLKVTHYSNGDPIQTGFTDSEWINLDDSETDAYAVYNDDPNNADIYGNLYNWYTVDDERGVCPEDWHIPSDDEWTELVGMGGGGKLKESGYDHWSYPNTGATNESGFTALPGGYRINYNGYYSHMDFHGVFWSSTEANEVSIWIRRLQYDFTVFPKENWAKLYGLSIRCIKDSE